MIPPLLEAPTSTSSCIVIPARLESSRLPRKMLLRETGKPLIQHTYEAASKATLPQWVCVATDSAVIADEVIAFGGRVQMTSPSCASGTDRAAEVARDLAEVDVVVNVQGDEPELSGEAIDLVVRLLDQTPSAMVATLATPIRSQTQLDDPACVKVVFDQSGRALYFSRSPIPHQGPPHDTPLSTEPPCFFQHVGLYAYRRDFLLRISTVPRSPLETIEQLEQLRVLESGYEIVVGVVDEPTFGIDTADDYRAFVERHRSG